MFDFIGKYCTVQHSHARFRTVFKFWREIKHKKDQIKTLDLFDRYIGFEEEDDDCISTTLEWFENIVPTFKSTMWRRKCEFSVG